MVFLFFILLTGISSPFAAGLVINEIEPTPNEGNQWIELFSDDEINLEGYRLRISSREYSLYGIFKGYFILERARWLENASFFELLNTNGEVVSNVTLPDRIPDTKTWSLCDTIWMMSDASKGTKNICDKMGRARSETIHTPHGIVRKWLPYAFVCISLCLALVIMRNGKRIFKSDL